MNFKQNISSVALFLAATSPAWALSPQAEADILKIEIKAALEAKSYEGLPAKFQRIADLKVGLSSTESFEYLWGQSCQEIKDPVCAVKHLETYINKFGSNGKFYANALERLTAVRADLAALDRELQKKKQEEAAAKAEDELYANLPIPKRPSQISNLIQDDIWQELEGSNAYKRYAATAKRKPVLIQYREFQSYESYEKWEFIYEDKISAIESSAFVYGSHLQTRCTPIKTIGVSFCGYRSKGRYLALGGLIYFGTKPDEKPGNYADNLGLQAYGSGKSVSKLNISKESLFPLRNGSKMSLQINDDVFTYVAVRSFSAKSIDDSFSGTAWEIKTNYSDNIVFLEDYGIFTFALDDSLLSSKKCYPRCGDITAILKKEF